MMIFFPAEPRPAVELLLLTSIQEATTRLDPCELKLSTLSSSDGWLGFWSSEFQDSAGNGLRMVCLLTLMGKLIYNMLFDQKSLDILTEIIPD